MHAVDPPSTRQFVRRACRRPGGVPNRGYRHRDRLGIASMDRHGRAVLREPLGDRAPDPARRPGDERASTYEPEVHRALRSTKFVSTALPTMPVTEGSDPDQPMRFAAGVGRDILWETDLSVSYESA
jgi:hypothetical protein